jgi:hypothetical protein
VAGLKNAIETPTVASLQTHTFAIRRPDGAPIDGVALVAPAARYATVYWLGAERLDRRFTDVTRWPEIERQIGAGFGGPLPRASAVFRLLGDVDREATVLFVRSRGVEVASPAGAAAALDAVLREEAGAAS